MTCFKGKGSGKWNRTTAWKRRAKQQWDSGGGRPGEKGQGVRRGKSEI